MENCLQIHILSLRITQPHQVVANLILTLKRHDLDVIRFKDSKRQSKRRQKTLYV